MVAAVLTVRASKVAVVCNTAARTRTVTDLQLQAAQVKRAHAELNRWINVDRDRWNEATENLHQ